MSGTVHMPCGCPYPALGDRAPCVHGLHPDGPAVPVVSAEPESFFAWADRTVDAEEAVSGTAPGRAAYEARRSALPHVPMPSWEHAGSEERAAAQAAIEAAAEHPACDAHRWYAVVRHCGSFAYGFAATSDGLRVWDDASEFEHAKARDFE